jgi:RHS repeat-associated protein
VSALRLLAALALLLTPAAAFAQASLSPYTSATRYDLAGRVTGTILPDPDGPGALQYPAVRNTYDAAGHLVRVETGQLSSWQSETVAPASWSGFTIFRTLDTTYDAMGRKLTDSLREGTAGPVRIVTQYSYDPLGRLECTAVRMNQAAFGSLPASACTLGAQGSDGPDRITHNVTDVWGEVLQVQRAYGTSSQINEATYTYSANGRRTSVTDANNNRAEMTWDGFDRQTRWTFPSTTTPGTANPADYEEYGYDPNANRVSLRKRDASLLQYQYDALNRVILKIVPERSGLDPSFTRDIYYAYDLRNLQTGARFDSSSGDGISNAYDGFGRLASSTIQWGSFARTLSYQYDADGDRLRITHPDGRSFVYAYDGLDRNVVIYDGADMSVLTEHVYNPDGSPYAIWRPTAVTHYSEDGVGRLAGISHDLGGSSGDVDYGFSRNAASQIASRTRSNDAYAWGGAYAVNRNYSVNGLNQYTAAGSASFSYDANGNLTADGSRTYTYDVENRMVGASGGVQLGYDPLGRLAWSTGNPNFTRFLYDGDALVAEYDYNGNLVSRYVHGTDSGADDPLVWFDSNNNRRDLHTDHENSIVAVTDAAGSPLAFDSYDEWGIPGASNLAGERFQYTGQAWLPELGMYYYKARIYSPTLGRFMQTDPVGYTGGINLYEYVGDDPVNHSDPSGLCHRVQGECIVDVSVDNEAHRAEAQRQAGALQPVIQDVDHSIHALSDKQRISILSASGHVIGTISGRDLKRDWDRETFTVTDRPSNNGGVGSAGNGHVEYNMDGVREYSSQWGRSGLAYLALHETGHNSAGGRHSFDIQTAAYRHHNHGSNAGFYTTGPEGNQTLFVNPEARANERYANSFSSSVAPAIPPAGHLPIQVITGTYGPVP